MARPIKGDLAKKHSAKFLELQRMIARAGGIWLHTNQTNAILFQDAQTGIRIELLMSTVRTENDIKEAIRRARERRI
jgi:hypothetical protein